MKIFVTVGHTRFDALFIEIDKISNNGNWFFTHQISDGFYTPKSGESFTFTENIKKHYNDADVVITHAGAGTVFELLELNKKIIVVNNTNRVDSHQGDLTIYVNKHNYALTCNSLNELESLLRNIIMFNSKRYKKEKFKKSNDILHLLNI
jgi:UDP-N-acetylglucosamine transferase subunit ALG13